MACRTLGPTPFADDSLMRFSDNDDIVSASNKHSSWNACRQKKIKNFPMLSEVFAKKKEMEKKLTL